MQKRQTNVLLVTVAVFIATFMTAIEGTIVTTAMPTIVGTLHGIEIMNWVFSIYLLTSAMVTPIYGKLADKIGRKPVFIFGTLIFIIGSALCGFSNSMMTLILARAVQGIGAGAMMPVSLTIIADMYSPEKRAKIIGLTSTAWGIASIVGPMAGGLIVDSVGWNWIFFINVPIGILLIAMIGLYLVEGKREAEAKKMDILGSLTLMLALMSLLVAFQILGDSGINFVVIGLLLATIIFFILFVMVEKRAEDPVISLELFKNQTFIIANLVAALVSGFLMSLDVYIPMWMQGVLGYSAGIGGLVLAPMSILWIYGSNLSSKWLTTKSVKWVLTVSTTITFIAGLALVLIPANSPFIVFVLISSLLGVGLGAVIVSTTVISQNSVPQEELGVATSFNTLAKTIGQTIMISVFGIVLNTVMKATLVKENINVDKGIMNQLVNPHTASSIPADLLKPLKNVLFQGLHGVFLTALSLVLISILVVQLIKSPKK
ncbi:multidrug MFS transporter [Floricoccus penangensis]|uniref:Multidrug MFS transporter n=1 Tax=Floricoccus penangensis TaxID=1859475 RepID=A0A9Q5JI84_9LACT|nr:MDR family MFS transporter [Floricoccus penangensis]OFI47688.1 multidrug MFS transporter [Floricoccus penangensis]